MQGHFLTGRLLLQIPSHNMQLATLSYNTAVGMLSDLRTSSLPSCISLCGTLLVFILVTYAVCS